LFGFIVLLLHFKLIKMELTNVSPDQLAALRNNFETIVISEAEEKGKYDVTIPMKTDLDAMKLFYAGAEYGSKRLSNSITSKY